MVLAVADGVAEQPFAVDDDGGIGRRLENAGLVAFAGNRTGKARAYRNYPDQRCLPAGWIPFPLDMG
jgi:hypothetical protein